MAICIFSRRGIHVRQGRGEITALLVPSHDQIAVYRDTSMTTADVAQRSGSTGKIPLWREVSGSTVMYGLLPDELKQDRHALKAWLASDFAPADAEAFFYLFEKRWLIHGVRETDDEGRQSWRTTAIQHEPDQIFQVVADNTADLMLSGSIRTICVAVDGDLQAYRQLRELLEPLQLAPVPFSILKPSARLKVLYRQRDFTLLMMVSVSFLVLVVLATVGWWVVNNLKLSKLNDQVADVRQQISNIQLNDNLGKIEDPEQVLQSMKPLFTQQPSAIIDAGSRLAAGLGALESVGFDAVAATETADPGTDPATATQNSLKVLTAEVSQMRQKLLVNQEKMAKSLVAKLPWVREVASLGGRDDSGATLKMVLQIDSPSGDDGQVVPSPTEVVDVDALAAAAVIPEDPSATDAVSRTTVGAAASSSSLPTVSSTSAMVSATAVQQSVPARATETGKGLR